MLQYFAFLKDTSSIGFWAAWALALAWQNYAFTFVSRARNSASIKSHAIAAIQSNGVWFLQSLFVYSTFMDILTGKAGIWKAIGAALYYTVFTMSGSLYAHYVRLRKEAGDTAVGASKKYAQITKEEWARISSLAEQAYTCAVNDLPVAATAQKIAGETVITK